MFIAPIAASSAPTTTGNYRLQGSSPTIDAGNNLSVTATTDLDGNPRIVNGVVDMGAYEKQPGPALGLTKQVTPTAAVAYQGVVTYTLVLSNSGGAADGAVILTDTLPAGATFARWIEQNGAAIDAGQLTWGSAAVDAGAAITVSFAVTNTAGGGTTVTNTAWFSGSLQTGSATAAYTTSTTLAPSGSGNWNEVFPPCTGVCKYTIPAGVAITLTTDITLTGDLEVEPGGTFAPNGRTVTLTGDRAQTLTGNPLTFYNLVVNKTAKTDTVTIVGKLKVTKKLTVRTGKLVSASDYGDIEIGDDGELELTSDITVGGHFTMTGNATFTPNTYAVTFDGATEQNVAWEYYAAFWNLTVTTGTTLIEVNSADNVGVENELTNYGVIRKTQPVTAVGNYNNFGLAGNYSYGLEIDVTDLTGGDPLTAIQVDRSDRPQPNGPAGFGPPIYWTITGTGSDFTADVTLPYPNGALARPLACRYRAGVWTCAQTTFGMNYVTFGGAMAFSDWAVYGCYPSVTVTATADSGAGTLRQAIADVCRGGVVDFDLSYPATITLTSAQLTIGKDMTIAGPGATNLAVSGADARRVFSITTGASVTLDGLTIRDGNAGAENGGGIYNSGALTLTNSSVFSNTAAFGGGMYNERTSPVITNVTFSGNHAIHGGAMYNHGYNGVSSPTLINVTFSGNQAIFGGGGAMYNEGAAGGVSSPSLTAVTFSDNQADAEGGAMHNNGYSGGTSSPSLINVIFWGNTASNGGAMYNNNVSSPSLINVTFSGNRANYGGAMFNRGAQSRTSMVNVTFSGNRATNGSGGAMYNDSSSPSLINVILWGNTASDGGAQMTNFQATPSIHHSLIPSTTADIKYIFGGVITWGAGNITGADADPRFIAPIAASSAPTTTGDYHLRACSPAIDAGNSLSVTVATDLDANPRIQGFGVDMGAYEAALMPCLQLAKAVTPTTDVPYQGVVTYTLVLSNSGNLTETAALTDALPAQVAFGGWVANPGAGQAGNVITWSGPITPATALTYVFTATHTGRLAGVITNTAIFSGALQAGSADASYNALAAYTVTVLADPDVGGTATGGGSYNHGASVVVTATANAGYTFMNWTESGSEVATTAVYTFTASANRTLVANCAPLPTARNDAAGALEATPVTIAVLANDIDPAGQGLTVITVTQGANGAVVIAADGRTVIYTPTAVFTGTDSFTYGVQDGNGITDDALVAVVVASEEETDSSTQVAAADPAISQTVAFSSTQTGVSVELPAGFYSGTVEGKDIFFLAFTPIVTPTHTAPPSGLKFGDVIFTLEAFLNNAPLGGITFATPVTLTLAYSPAQFSGIQLGTLALYAWDADAGNWSPDGITCSAPDTVNSTLTCVIAHLTEFGILGNASPTAATLANFSAAATADAVTVLWTTADESNLAGFQLYRGAAADDPGVRLNGTLIPAQGAGGLGGFSYSYVDAVATPPGAVWFYWLETVDFAGGATRHGPILAAALAPRLYLPAVMAGAGGAALERAPDNGAPLGTPAAPVDTPQEEVLEEAPAAATPTAAPAETAGAAATIHLPLITR